MKKLFAILLTLAMLLSLAACGGETAEDPNAGKYMGTTAKAFGMTMEMAEIYPGETWLELKSGGKGTIMLDGDSFSAKWTLAGDTFTLTIDGEDSVGALKNGVIVLDLMNLGVEMTFVKEGMEAPVAAATYNDAGYWEVVRVESEDPDSVITEEDMVIVKAAGVMMYLELKEDGTGVLFMDEAMPITWQDGAVTFTEDAMTVSYTVENGELALDMIDMVFVLRKGAQTVGPESESEAEVVVPQSGDAGLYEGTTYEYGGLTFALTDIYKDRCTIELANDGTAVLTLDTEKMDCTWTLDGENFVLTYYTVASPGTLKDGQITIDYMGTGMMMTFAKNGAATGNNVSVGTVSSDNTFPDAFAADHQGDWHGMAIVYEGTGVFEDEVDKEMEIIARLAFEKDGTCQPYLACAFGGKDNNFKNLKATYSAEEDVMLLSGEFVNSEIVSESNLFAQDGALYVDVYVEDEQGNTMNLYACLRPLDAAWDYDNDWLNLSQDAVSFYKGKSFVEIAELFQLDLGKIPALDGADAPPSAPVETPAEAPTAAATEAPAAAVSGFGGTSSYQIKESLSGIVTTVTVTLPDAMWIPDAPDSTLYLYNVEKLEDAYSNSPRIQFVVKQSLEKINFYLDTFENLKELDSRVIGGIEMKGRSYKTVGMEWIEYFAELPNGVWISVQTSRTSIEPGSEGSAILDSVTFG